MQRAERFRALEADGGVRADPWEGYDFIGQPTRGKLVLRFADGRVMEPKLNGPILLNRGWAPQPHVYCMTVISGERASAAHEKGEPLLSHRVREFGEAAVVVLDVGAWVSRVKDACDRLGLPHAHRVVHYVPEHHHGEIDAFSKHLRFEWQSEFRTAVWGFKGEYLELRLGPLHDIAALGTTQEVLNTIRYEPSREHEG